MTYIKTFEGLFKKSSGSLTDYDIKMALIELEDIGLIVDFKRTHSALEKLITVVIHKGNPTGLVLNRGHFKRFDITEEIKDILLTFLEYAKDKNITIKNIEIQGRYNSPVDEGITIVKNIKEFEKQLRLFKKDVFAITIKLKIY